MPSVSADTDQIYDYIIVGQGIAGTTLAWHLIAAGKSVLIIDADKPESASRIAAGLITPITGQRLALSWRIDEMLAAARAFYPRIEALTGAKFFHDRTAIRLFATDLERAVWAKRRDWPAYQRYQVQPQPAELLDPHIGDASGGGFHMQTAQLDVATYLAASREHIAHHAADLDWQRDVAISPTGVSAAGFCANTIISCEGYAATRNPHFAWLPFKGAKGDILTVRFDRDVAGDALHRGIWVVPTGTAREFRVGATYEWQTLDCVPSAAGRAEIERRLQEFVHVPYEVIRHEAAVRPIIRESKALVGMHPDHDRLGIFNGLGSKGSLHAPFFAGLFAAHLTRGEPLPAVFDVAQRHPKR